MVPRSPSQAPLSGLTEGFDQQVATENEEFPLPSRQHVAIDFIENRTSEFRDTHGQLPCRYDPMQHKFVPKPPKELQAEVSLDIMEEEVKKSKMQLVTTNESFSRALTKLKAESKAKAVACVNLDACDDWEDVGRALEKLIADYTSDKGAWAKVRKIFRNVGDNSKSIQSFVQILPDGQYKPLAGGLTLILTAMLRHSEFREKIAELLQELPDIVNACEQYSILYPGRNTMTLCVNEVYLHLLQALEDVAHWMMQNTGKRVFDSLLRNSSYGQSFDVRLKNLRRAKLRFVDETALYQAWQSRQTWHVAQETLDTSLQTFSTIHETLTSIKETDANVQDLRRECTAGLNGLREILRDNIKNAEWSRKKDEEMEKLRCELQQKKQTLEEKDRLISDLQSHRDRNTFKPTAIMHDLNLDIERDTHLSDIPAVLRYGLQEGIDFQNRAGWVSQAPEFQDWINSNESSVLFIQGKSTFQRTSPLSFLVSLLSENLQDQPGALVLPFFCGRETAEPQFNGPTTMTRAFFVQMLASYDSAYVQDDKECPFLRFMEAQHIMRLKDGCLDAYIAALGQLILEFRRNLKAVFVLVDGVDFFDSDWESEVLQFIRGLSKVVRKAKRRTCAGAIGGPVKVLLTTSTQSRCFANATKSAVMLEVPEDITGEQNSFEKFMHKM